MVTYRLSDALPQGIGKRRADEAGPDRTMIYRRRIESSLDAGHGSCCLRHPILATEIVSTWKRFDPERYRLLAWVVMPNHVHVLFQMTGGWPLAKIVQSWKSWTGKAIAKRQGELGLASPRGWQREYWDRYVRDEAHFLAAVDYIHNNPVIAGLCRTASGWRWSSLGEAIPSSPHNEASPTSKTPLDDEL